MSNEWTTVKLEDAAAKIDRPFAMGPFGSNIKAINYQATGVPVIRGINLNDVGGLPFNHSDFVYLSENKADELSSSSTFPSDIVFVAQGSVGRVGIIPKKTKYKKFILSQNLMKVTVNTDMADPLYVYYYFRSAIGQHEILSFMNPTGVPCISRPLTSLKAFKITLPSNVSEQKAIASILGALDDKIELNRKMNETLEAMARTIFKSWFVDFAPIPGLGSHKAWQDSQVGKIPKGWRITQVSEAFEVNPSIQIKKGLQYAHVDMASLPTKSARVTNITRREFTGSGSKFKNGDVLFARITPCLENGKTALVDFLPENEYGWGSTEFFIFGPKEPLNPWFVYCAARDQEFRDHAIRAMSGTSGRQRVEIGCFDNYSIVVPPPEIVVKFGDVVKPWFVQMKINDEQSQTLASIRDTLLPKLLSGNLRVKIMESVT